MKNKVQVKIDGVMVTIVGIESEEYMTKVAEYIDKKMAEIKKSDTGRSLNVRLVPILASINIADDYFKEKNKNENLSFIIEKLKKINKNAALELNDKENSFSKDTEQQEVLDSSKLCTQISQKDLKISELEELILKLKNENTNLLSQKEVLEKEIEVLKYDNEKLKETSKKEAEDLHENILNLNNQNNILKIQNKNLKVFLENNNIDSKTGLPLEHDLNTTVENSETTNINEKNEDEENLPSLNSNINSETDENVNFNDEIKEKEISYDEGKENPIIEESSEKEIENIQEEQEKLDNLDEDDKSQVSSQAVMNKQNVYYNRRNNLHPPKKKNKGKSKYIR